MRTVLALLLLASSLHAQQQCASRNDDGTLATNSSTGGPNLSIGLRLIADANYTISAAQVHTGLRSGPGSFAIWSHDAAGNRPLTNLSGNGAYQQETFLNWQGAALPTPVPLSLGQVFWLVWSMPNSSRTPLATSPTVAVPYRGSFDGGLTWNGSSGGSQPWPGQPYKVRLFCDYPTNPILSVGNGKAGVFGVPDQSVLGWAAMGNELSFTLSNAAPVAPALCLIGSQALIQLPGLADLYVLPAVTLSMTTDGTPGRSSGSASLALRIPPGATGYPLATQWLIVDAAAAAGISHTDGAHVTIR